MGSATQHGMLLLPFAVIFGMLIGVPMNLDFSPLLVVSLFASVLAVVLIAQNGETSWLKAVMLLSAYAVIVCAICYTEATLLTTSPTLVLSSPVSYNLTSPSWLEQ